MPEHGTCVMLRQHRTSRAIRSVFRDGREIIKEYRRLSWPGDLRRRWKREHQALLRLSQRGVLAPRTFGYESPERGLILHRREFIAGERLQTIEDIPGHEFAAHVAAIHRAGVTNGDASLDNLLLTDRRQILFIDYGRASVFLVRGPLFYFHVGKELARIRRRLFAHSLARWRMFLADYRRCSTYPAWGWAVTASALSYWLRRWGLASSADGAEWSADQQTC